MSWLQKKKCHCKINESKVLFKIWNTINNSTKLFGIETRKTLTDSNNVSKTLTIIIRECTTIREPIVENRGLPPAVEKQKNEITSRNVTILAILSRKSFSTLTRALVRGVALVVVLGGVRFPSPPPPHAGDCCIYTFGRAYRSVAYAHTTAAAESIDFAVDETAFSIVLRPPTPTPDGQRLFPRALAIYRLEKNDHNDNNIHRCTNTYIALK